MSTEQVLGKEAEIEAEESSDEDAAESYKNGENGNKGDNRCEKNGLEANSNSHAVNFEL